MMAWKIGLPVGAGLFAAGEIPGIGELGPIIQGGAVAVLTWVAWQLFRELRETREQSKNEREQHQATIKQLCDRWDGWEQSRHTDHESLNSTLAALRENCAAVAEKHRRGT